MPNLFVWHLPFGSIWFWRQLYTSLHLGSLNITCELHWWWTCVYCACHRRYKYDTSWQAYYILFACMQWSVCARFTLPLIHTNKHYNNWDIVISELSYAYFHIIYSHVLGKVDPWKLVMCLKSGQLCESVWALDTITILLRDDNSLLFFTLKKMPGLLDVLLAHYKYVWRGNLSKIVTIISFVSIFFILLVETYSWLYCNNLGFGKFFTENKWRLNPVCFPTLRYK